MTRLALGLGLLLAAVAALAVQAQTTAELHLQAIVNQLFASGQAGELHECLLLAPASQCTHEATAFLRECHELGHSAEDCLMALSTVTR